MAISPLSFNIFIHALQVSSSSADFDCNRNDTINCISNSCNLVCKVVEVQRKQYHLADMIIELIVLT